MRPWIAALVLLPLLAVACGDGDDGGGASAGDDRLEVRVSFDEPLRVGPVTWTVAVANPTDGPVELEFTSSQRADVTLTQNGEEVYRWSRALLFTQELGSERVAADDEAVFPLDEPGLDVDPGAYTLTATVTASNRELRTERQVTVAPMQR